MSSLPHRTACACIVGQTSKHTHAPHPLALAVSYSMASFSPYRSSCVQHPIKGGIVPARRSPSEHVRGGISHLDPISYPRWHTRGSLRQGRTIYSSIYLQCPYRGHRERRDSQRARAAVLPQPGECVEC